MKKEQESETSKQCEISNAIDRLLNDMGWSLEKKQGPIGELINDEIVLIYRFDTKNCIEIYIERGSFFICGYYNLYPIYAEEPEYIGDRIVEEISRMYQMFSDAQETCDELRMVLSAKYIARR